MKNTLIELPTISKTTSYANNQEIEDRAQLFPIKIDLPKVPIQKWRNDQSFEDQWSKSDRESEVRKLKLIFIILNNLFLIYLII